MLDIPMTYEPTLAWHVSLPLTDLPIGPALTAEQREIEERIGVTREILWAYAEAMPQLLGEFIMEDIQPLGFGRGALVAIATETPVRLPHVRFVQTSSVDVCHEMGSFVREFHVKGQACLDALIQSGSAVRKVWVRDCRAFEVHAPFEVEFLEIGTDTPFWQIRFGNDHLLRLAVIDEDAWLCWDRDERHPVIDVDHKPVPGRFGPRDVAPENAPPPWASPAAWALGGTGWAATMLHRYSSQTEDQVFATPDKRFLLVHSFPGYPGHDAIVRAWREKVPMRPFLEGTNTRSVGAGLDLYEREARFYWVGLHRVLRIRNGRIEQLTTDHDLSWQLSRSDPGLFASFDQSQLAQYKNVVVTSIGSHDWAEGTCDLLPKDRLVLLDARAHERLLEVAPQNLAARLSAGTVRDAANWAACALRQEDGTMRYPALFVDANATVTIAPWYDDSVPMQCVESDEAAWRLFSSIGHRPWINPLPWRKGIREQMARGRLLPITPNEGDVLNFTNFGYSFVWRDGDWHDVRIDENTFKLRAKGTVTFSDRGAIDLAKRFSGAELPEELDKAGLHSEAMWIRTRDTPTASVHKQLSRQVSGLIQKTLPRSPNVCTPSVRDLVERPNEFHGRRIRTRGIFRCIFEGMTFADAWFDCSTRMPMGLWMVEVDGLWSSDGSQYGHFGFYKSHLRGDARLISIREPRWVEPDRIQFSRPYVPLITEVTIERRLQGFTYNGRWLSRLGGDSRLPEPNRPDSCRARIVYANTAFHALCLFSWTFLSEPKPLVPEIATADKPGPRGRYVELKGILTPNGSNWPLLDGVLRIVPPPMSTTSDRYPMPQPNVQEAMKSWLGNGKAVRIVGEVGLEAKIIYAFSVESSDGPFEVPR